MSCRIRVSGTVVLAERTSRSGMQAPTCTCPKSLPPVVPGAGAHHAWDSANTRGAGQPPVAEAVPPSPTTATRPTRPSQARQCEPDARSHAVLPRVTQVQGEESAIRTGVTDPGLDHNTVEDPEKEVNPLVPGFDPGRSGKADVVPHVEPEHAHPGHHLVALRALHPLHEPVGAVREPGGVDGEQRGGHRPEPLGHHRAGDPGVRVGVQGDPVVARVDVTGPVVDLLDHEVDGAAERTVGHGYAEHVGLAVAEAGVPALRAQVRLPGDVRAALAVLDVRLEVEAGVQDLPVRLGHEHPQPDLLQPAVRELRDVDRRRQRDRAGRHARARALDRGHRGHRRLRGGGLEDDADVLQDARVVVQDHGDRQRRARGERVRSGMQAPTCTCP